jgi:hypothetical protein
MTLAGAGAATLLLVMRPSTPATPHTMWWLFLVVAPVVLIVTVLTGKAWAAMFCVAYGTIGLALDVATVVSIVARQEGLDLTLGLSFVSGSANFLLIVFGGRAFWAALEGRRPPGYRPPNPPSPSSSLPA